MPEARAPLVVRVKPAGEEWIEKMRTSIPNVSKSDVIRASLAVARKHESEVREVLKERNSA